MSTTIIDCKLIEVPKITDPRGNIGVLEKNTLPFEIKRVYYLFDAPSNAHRGGHAHIDQLAFMIALSGSFDVKLDDGKNTNTITLNKPDRGLLIPTGIWRELDNFSAGAVCLVISSGVYNEADYIRDYEAFVMFKNSSR